MRWNWDHENQERAFLLTSVWFVHYKMVLVRVRHRVRWCCMVNSWVLWKQRRLMFSECFECSDETNLTYIAQNHKSASRAITVCTMFTPNFFLLQQIQCILLEYLVLFHYSTNFSICYCYDRINVLTNNFKLNELKEHKVLTWTTPPTALCQLLIGWFNHLVWTWPLLVSRQTAMLSSLSFTSSVFILLKAFSAQHTTPSFGNFFS